VSDRLRTDAAAGLGPKAKWVAAKALWRQFLAEQEQSATTPDLRIGLAASFTANTLVPFVGAHLISSGFKPEVEVGPYNQLFQVCLDPHGHFGGNCDSIVLLWRIEDLMAEDIDAFLHRDGSALTRAIDKLGSIASAISNLRSNFSGMIIVSVPAVPTALVGDLMSLDHPTNLGAFHRAVTTRFVEIINKLQDVRVVDLDAVQRQVGFSASFDARQWYLYRQPFSDAFLREAGTQIGRIIVAARRTAKKCVVLDCDNTLWGGIVGEDGLDDIELGNDYPGSAFCDFQRLLVHWRKQGIFLALLSKNNEPEVWEIFDHHRAMVLNRTDISAWQINWQPKAENIVHIAEALNIGTDSLVFLDDNPMEIAYMQQARPEVTSILLPEDPADIVSTLQSVTLFDRLEVTDEDLARVDMMRAEANREKLGAKMSKDEFLQALDLEFDLFLASSHDLGRITQLINKTNQFNLTTIRRTLDEVRVLANSPTNRVYALRVSDRFGDYGLTGALILDISSNGQVWTINTLLVSCRVLGRGVETGLLAALASDACAEGAVEFVASFIPTKKNGLAATFLPDHGFKPDGDRWRLLLADAPKLPAFVRRLGKSTSEHSGRAA
jgi:FkbH-like protein